MLGALARANDLVAGRTHGTDLRALVPVGLGMLALRQLVRGEQRLAVSMDKLLEGIEAKREAIVTKRPPTTRAPSPTSLGRQSRPR